MIDNERHEAYMKRIKEEEENNGIWSCSVGRETKENNKMIMWDMHNHTTKEQAKQNRKKKSSLPTSAKERKAIPVYTGFIKYFPDAIVEISKVSLKGGIQHGQTPETLHWDRSKSGDELDAMMRHLIDEDWAQVAWRALANLQKQIERSRDD